MARRSKPPGRSNVIPLFPKNGRVHKQPTDTRTGRRTGQPSRLPAEIIEAKRRAERAGEIAIDAYHASRSSFYAIRKNLEAAEAYARVAILLEEAGRVKRAKFFRETSVGFLAEAKFYYAQLRRQGRDAPRTRSMER